MVAALTETALDTIRSGSGPHLSSASLRSPPSQLGPRYRDAQVIAKGGMGLVCLAHDMSLDRRVAMKVVRRELVAEVGIRERFIHEARIQGMLQHPAILPVYDLGTARDGETFFTMPHIRGVTLGEILSALADDDRMKARFPTRRLLEAFSRVCLAIDFAHQRGIIHRDLKPANVMLGDFGETYVLDWGLAKETRREGRGESEPPLTTAGMLLGTPGYMSPEQTLTPTVRIDLRTDIYSLGAILFEILTLVHLHPRGTQQEIIDATRRGADARASIRAPDRDVPPELEAICMRATATKSAARFASAREMYEAIERYRDGERDHEMRARSAEQHAREASALAKRALGGNCVSEERDRAAAMRALGRALALNPRHEQAKKTLARLLLEPPKEPISDAEADVRRSYEESSRDGSRAGVLSYGSWFLFAPLWALMGVKEFMLGGIIWFGISVLVFVQALGLHWRRWLKIDWLVSALLSTVIIGLLSRWFGPFVLVPAIAAANTTACAMNPIAWQRRITTTLGALAVAVPALLEWSGAVAPSYAFRDGMMCILRAPRRSHPARRCSSSH